MLTGAGALRNNSRDGLFGYLEDISGFYGFSFTPDTFTLHAEDACSEPGGRHKPSLGGSRARVLSDPI